MKIARIYLRVSTDEQDLTRQNEIIENARNNGFYVAGIYKEKASGARADRPELQRGLTLSGTKTHVKQRFLPLTPLLMVSDVLWSPVLPA